MSGRGEYNLNNQNKETAVEIVTAYPFVVYTDSCNQNVMVQKEPIIHINTLAQIIYRACSQDASVDDVYLIVMDPYAVKGIGEAGLFEVDFIKHYMKRIGELQDVLPDVENQVYRLGIVHVMDYPDRIQNLKKTISLHGDLKDVLQRQTALNSKETVIQWISK
jgi:hypothetical protein